MKSMKVLQVIAMLLIVSIISCKKDSTVTGNPKVVSTNPSSNLTGVPRNQAIAFTFSEAMDSTTINDSTFILKQGSTVVPGKVTYSGTTATFTPTTALASGTRNFAPNASNPAIVIAGLASSSSRIHSRPSSTRPR